MILYKMQPDGSFVAGDTERDVTAYAYPTSPNAVKAQRDPVGVAKDMTFREDKRLRANLPLADERHAHWMAVLKASGEVVA